MKRFALYGVLAVCAGFLFLYPAMQVFAQTIPVRVVRFEDVKPDQVPPAVITSNFEGIGFDNAGKVFVTLCDANETIPGRGNCFVFSWNPTTGAKRYYDNFLDAAKRANNLGPNAHWPNRETLVKGHTHLSYMNGKMWMGSMNAHGYGEADLPKHRGLHIFSLDINGTGKLTDHSASQPKGVFHERGGTYTMAVIPDQNLVLSIGIPNCTIIKYNTVTGAVSKTPGVPPENVAQLSGRDMVLLAGNKLLYQCGSGNTKFGLYDVDDGTNEIVDFQIDNPISLAYASTADGQHAYINSSTNIYRFDLSTKTGVLIDSLMADATNRQTGPVNLSPDEKKLYYVVNMTGPEPSPYLMDLYEYNLETGVRTKLRSLQPILGEGAKLSGSHAMKPNWKFYQTFNGTTAGIVEMDLSSRAGGAPGTVATPTIAPNGGTFTGSQSVTLSTITLGATIRYTTDGSAPTAASTLYSGAFTITDTTTVKAKGFKTGSSDSAVASATFTKTGGPATVATPTIAPNGGTFTTSQSITLSTATAGADIRYTTDGSNPTSASTLYDAPFTITNTATIKAKGFKTGMTDSAVASATFTKTGGGPGACLRFQSNSAAPVGYGASWDVLSPAKELLVKSNCPTSGNDITITVGKGDASQYIWQHGYVYNSAATPPSWTMTTLTGTVNADGWITSGAGTKTITTPFAPTAGNPLYFVGYVCTYHSSMWKCGCANASCFTKYWQLQAYTGL